MSLILSRAQTSQPETSGNSQISSIITPQSSEAMEMPVFQDETQPSTSNSFVNSTSNALAINQRETNNTVNDQGIFPGANISNCQFQIFHGPVKIVQDRQKRRIVIDSDDED